MKIDIIFEIPTIENPKIDITLDFWWYTPSGPCGGWGYLKMKIEIIFEIPTIENSLWPPQVPPLLERPWGGGSKGVALLNLKTS